MSAQSLKGRIHAVATFWIAKQSLEHLEAIRMQELSTALEHIPAASSILEIGAGTGWQARELERHGHAVSAIDLASSNYRAHLVWPVTEYDGEHIPFPNNSFDIVFSSNVLEHIPHLPEFETEIIRVLKPTGRAIHVVPSSSWCVWTNFTTLLKHWSVAKPDGEHSSTATAEILTFARRSWRKLFKSNGWLVVQQKPIRLFYSGCSIMDRRLSINLRIKLSYLLGGSCILFVLQSNERHVLERPSS